MGVRIKIPGVLALVLCPALSLAGAAAELLPSAELVAARPGIAPVANAAFLPGKDPLPAPAFVGRLPEITRP
jgi:hypothetical protein